MANYIENLLRSAGIKLANSRANTEISEALLAYNIDEAKLQEGDTLLSEATDLTRGREKEFAEQKAATDQIYEITSRLRPVYSKLRKISKRIFNKDPEIYARLGLSYPFPNGYKNLETASSKFYTHLNDDIKLRLQKYNTTDEYLEEGRSLLGALTEGIQKAEKETGEAQQATKIRDAAIDTLEEWIDEFDFIARLALEEKPQLLEALDIFVRS